MQAPDLSACPDNCVRPVGLAFDPLGRLFGSSDTTGEIFMIESSSAPDPHLGASAGVSKWRMEISWTVVMMLAVMVVA